MSSFVRCLARRAAPLALLAPLVACGGGDGGGDAAPATLPRDNGTVALPGVRWPDDKCSILSIEDVSDLKGFEVETVDIAGIACQYEADGHGDAIFAVSYSNDPFECELVESNTDDPEAVDGLGARAFYGNGGTEQVLAVITDDERCFMVTTAGNTDEQTVAIAELVLDTL